MAGAHQALPDFARHVERKVRVLRQQGVEILFVQAQQFSVNNHAQGGGAGLFQQKGDFADETPRSEIGEHFARFFGDDGDLPGFDDIHGVANVALTKNNSPLRIAPPLHARRQ